jgi:hypothetical protein
LDSEKPPITIIVFEALNVASVVLAMMLTQSESPLGELFTSAWLVALTLWITRGRSGVARVVYTVLYVGGAAMLLGLCWLGYLPTDAKFLLVFRSTVEPAVLITLLWWPSSSDWLRKHQRGGAA